MRYDIHSPLIKLESLTDKELLLLHREVWKKVKNTGILIDGADPLNVKITTQEKIKGDLKAVEAELKVRGRDLKKRENTLFLSGMVLFLGVTMLLEPIDGIGFPDYMVIIKTGCALLAIAGAVGVFIKVFLDRIKDILLMYKKTD